MKSKCCNYKLKAVGKTTRFYICELCHKPSDPKEWNEETTKKVEILKLSNII